MSAYSLTRVRNTRYTRAWIHFRFKQTVAHKALGFYKPFLHFVINVTSWRALSSGVWSRIVWWKFAYCPHPQAWNVSQADGEPQIMGTIVQHRELVTYAVMSPLQIYCIVLPPVEGLCVTYKMVSGLGDWIHWHLIHTHNSELQAITVLSLSYTICSSLFHTHTGIPAFTSRIQATDLQQSHSHMKSSFHRLITFWPLFCQLSSIPLLQSSCPGRLVSRNSTNFSLTNTDHVESTVSLLLGRRVYSAVA
jgi:hypothetical protein